MLDSNHDPVGQPKRLPPNADDCSELLAGGSTDGENRPLDVARLAELVADGQAPFPSHFEPSTHQALVRHVAQLRRSRLLKFVARVIAHDIYQSRDSTKERN